MKYVWLAMTVVVLVAGVCIWVRARSRAGDAEAKEISYAELTDREKHVLGIIREVHGTAIVGEQFVKQNGYVRVRVTFDSSKSKLPWMDIGLTSLASKGVSDPVLKYMVTPKTGPNKDHWPRAA